MHGEVGGMGEEEEELLSLMITVAPPARRRSNSTSDLLEVVVMKKGALQRKRSLSMTALKATVDAKRLGVRRNNSGTAWRNETANGQGAPDVVLSTNGCDQGRRSVEEHDQDVGGREQQAQRSSHGHMTGAVGADSWLEMLSKASHRRAQSRTSMIGSAVDGVSHLSSQCRRIGSILQEECSKHLQSNDDDNPAAPAELASFNTPTSLMPGQTSNTRVAGLLLRLTDWVCAGRLRGTWRGSLGESFELSEMQTIDVLWLRSDACGYVLGALGHCLTNVVLFAVYIGVGRLAAGLVPLISLALLLAGMLVLRVVNISGRHSLELTLEWFARLQVVLALSTPFIMHILLGGAKGGRSSDLITWTLMAPIGMIFWSKGGELFGGWALYTLLLRSVLVVVIVGVDQQIPAIDEPVSAETRAAMFILNHLAVTSFIIAILRHDALVFLQRRQVILSSTKKLCSKLVKVEKLVHSLVPKFKSQSLSTLCPKMWCREKQDTFNNCTIVQMDISGFTHLSSTIEAEELIDLVHVIFTSIDLVADCLGKIWKVETIGDCYIGVIGGPNQCEDHAHRAVIFALCILENVRRIAERVALRLEVRIGVHSGDITAAVIGSSLPRYLIFGRDCEVVRMMESNGRPGYVQVSDSTAQLLPREWDLEPHTWINMCNGERIFSHLISRSPQNMGMMERAELLYPRVAAFHSWFRTPSHGDASSGSDKELTFDSLGSPAGHRHGIEVEIVEELDEVAVHVEEVGNGLVHVMNDLMDRRADSSDVKVGSGGREWLEDKSASDDKDKHRIISVKPDRVVNKHMMSPIRSVLAHLQADLEKVTIVTSPLNAASSIDSVKLNNVNIGSLTNNRGKLQPWMHSPSYSKSPSARSVTRFALAVSRDMSPLSRKEKGLLGHEEVPGDVGKVPSIAKRSPHHNVDNSVYKSMRSFERLGHEQSSAHVRSTDGMKNRPNAATKTARSDGYMPVGGAGSESVVTVRPGCDQACLEDDSDEYQNRSRIAYASPRNPPRMGRRMSEGMCIDAAHSRSSSMMKHLATRSPRHGPLGRRLSENLSLYASASSLQASSSCTNSSMNPPCSGRRLSENSILDGPPRSSTTVRGRRPPSGRRLSVPIIVEMGKRDHDSGAVWAAKSGQLLGPSLLVGSTDSTQPLLHIQPLIKSRRSSWTASPHLRKDAGGDGVSASTSMRTVPEGKSWEASDRSESYSRLGPLANHNNYDGGAENMSKAWTDRKESHEHDHNGPVRKLDDGWHDTSGHILLRHGRPGGVPPDGLQRETSSDHGLFSRSTSDPSLSGSARETFLRLTSSPKSKRSGVGISRTSSYTGSQEITFPSISGFSRTVSSYTAELFRSRSWHSVTVQDSRHAKLPVSRFELSNTDTSLSRQDLGNMSKSSSPKFLVHNHTAPAMSQDTDKSAFTGNNKKFAKPSISSISAAKRQDSGGKGASTLVEEERLQALHNFINISEEEEGRLQAFKDFMHIAQGSPRLLRTKPGSKGLPDPTARIETWRGSIYGTAQSERNVSSPSLDSSRRTRASRLEFTEDTSLKIRIKESNLKRSWLVSMESLDGLESSNLQNYSSGVMGAYSWLRNFAEESRRRLDQFIIFVFLGITGTGAAFYSIVHIERDRGVFAIAPGIFAIVAFCIAGYSLGINNNEGRRNTIRHISVGLLLVSPAVFVSGLDRLYCRTSVLWGFSGVVLQCICSPRLNFGFAALIFFAVVIILHAVMTALRTDEDENVLEGWDLVLLIINLIAPTSLFVLPLTLIKKHFRDDVDRARLLLNEKSEQVHMENLLLEALVPPTIGMRLCAGEESIADRYENTTVLFVYLDEYEEMLLDCGASSTITWLNDIFCRFDTVLSKRYKDTVTKVETFSNFYLAVSGCPEPCDLHAEQCVSAAISMIRAAYAVLRPDGVPTSVRVGLCSGVLCAGVTGNTSPRFSIFGDTVNVSSRMASTAQSSSKDHLSLHISESTAMALSESFLNSLSSLRSLQLEARGDGMVIKGKGFMQTYTLHKQVDLVDESLKDIEEQKDIDE